jgi:protein-S-isoprenylcysteine O-methyltransferase Ste14
MHTLKRIVQVLLAMAGILVDKITPLRVASYVILAALYSAIFLTQDYIHFDLALILFVLAFVIRYAFLFSSFVKNGISDYLKAQLGEEKGFDVYQFFTSIMFFSVAITFNLLVRKSSLLGSFFPEKYEALFYTAGITLTAIGFIVNVWSTLLVGIDIYYYKDMFLGRPVSKFKKAGPYKYLANPMYGLGQSGGYGAALFFGSATGLIGIAINQLLMFIFYFTIEKPHIEKLFGKKKTPSSKLAAGYSEAV